MENKVFKNITISTTSNKVGEFKQEVNTKTVYFNADEKTAKDLEAFGLTQYTSKENNENFFIVKVADKLRVYFPNGENQIRRDLSNVELEGQDTLNFKTADDTTVAINIVKGSNKGNDFHRLQAILVETIDDITQIESENPFA